MKQGKPFTFVKVEHIKRLTLKKESASRKVMRDLRTKYKIQKPKEITVDHVCDYYGITKEEFFDSQK